MATAMIIEVEDGDVEAEVVEMEVQVGEEVAGEVVDLKEEEEVEATRPHAGSRRLLKDALELTVRFSILPEHTIQDLIQEQREQEEQQEQHKMYFLLGNSQHNQVNHLRRQDSLQRGSNLCNQMHLTNPDINQVALNQIRRASMATDATK